MEARCLPMLSPRPPAEGRLAHITASFAPGCSRRRGPARARILLRRSSLENGHREDLGRDFDTDAALPMTARQRLLTDIAPCAHDWFYIPAG